ncbi:MAG: tRNA pseudouridine(55) synthase TruB [Clostridia bacterium]|nr:tRNA pseudouridine(55) synthase TruB [Clostridia bacterium]
MDGILIINKPKGYTSHDVVNVIRKKLNIKKVGHTGTLDPNATGVLPILVGQATKVSKYLIEHDKTYVAKLKLGEKTNTGDVEGEIVEKKDVPTNLHEEYVLEVLKKFTGKQKQTPPVYSAIKVNGKKAYEYARENKEIKLEAREIEIYKLDLIQFKENEITFEVECSKGTYIRTLCEDIAGKLGTVGFMKELERKKVNIFTIENAINLDDISEKNIISLEKIFEDRERIFLNKRKLELFLNGVKLQFNLKDELYRIYSENNFIGLGIVKDGILKRDVIIEKEKNNIDEKM